MFNILYNYINFFFLDFKENTSNYNYIMYFLFFNKNI